MNTSTPLTRNHLLGLVTCLMTLLGPMCRLASAQTAYPHTWRTNGPVFANAVNGTTLHFGGRFTHAFPPTGGCAVFDVVTGERDRRFPRVNGQVLCALPDGSGGWFLGGDFTSIGGVPRSNFAHVLADGSLDPRESMSGVTGRLFAMARSGDTLYIGGELLNIAATSRKGVASLDLKTGTVTGWAPNPNGTVYTIATHGNTVFIGGGFSGARLNLAAVSATTGQYLSWNANTNGMVTRLAVHGNTLYALGGFSLVGGASHSGLAAIDVASGAVSAWNPTVSVAASSLSNMIVRGSTIYVSGSFSQIGGQPRAGIAALDSATGLATNWQPPTASLVPSDTDLLVCQLLYDRDGASFHYLLSSAGPVSALLSPLPFGIADGAISLATSAEGRMLVAGAFQGLGGVARRNLAALDMDTGELRPWTCDADSTVTALAMDGGTLYVGGVFATLGGIPRPFLGAVSGATGVPSGWNPIPNGPVRTLAAGHGVVYAGGSFTTIGAAPRSRIAALDRVTGLATAWNAHANWDVRCILPVAGRVFAAGDFTIIGGQSRSYLAELDTITGAATAWNPEPNLPVQTLCTWGSRLVAGGTFTTLGATTTGGLAAFEHDGTRVAGWPALAGPMNVWDVVAHRGDVIFANGELGRVDSTGQTSAFASFYPDAATDGSPGLVSVGDLLVVGAHYGPKLLRPLDESPPEVSVLFPNGEESLPVGTTWPIQWSATDDLAVQTVDVSLSRLGPFGTFETLALGYPNSGQFDWTVTGPAVALNNACLMVTARDYSNHSSFDLSDFGFNILSGSLGVANPEPATPLGLTSAPNPVRGRATIRFTLGAPARVQITAFDVQGREVENLAHRDFAQGTHFLNFDTSRLPPGEYYLRLRSGQRQVSKRLTIAR
ncbi:MAG: T9SS type A sorting domain-containing protein [Candidatus Eisenbacteria bacterium]